MEEAGIEPDTILVAASMRAVLEVDSPTPTISAVVYCLG